MNHSNFRFFDLENKTLLITGTTKGIGKAALPILLEQGLNLISVSNDRELMEDIRAELGVDETRLRLYQCDLVVPAEVEKVANEIAASDCRLDAIWHNAAMGKRQAFESMETDSWQELLQVNVLSAAALTRRLLPKLKASKQGRIIFTSSVLFELGSSHRASYVSSKGVVEGLTRSLAHELKHSGITVNCLAPGAILTRQVSDPTPESLKVLSWQSVGRRLLSADMLGPVCLLLSEAGGGISGQVWKIDGGLIHPLADPELQRKYWDNKRLQSKN
jgi:3-oxoacyl-[acyl-carrier protein] reductase